ncbi:hypothetical protein VTO73DRAFT_2838 [Trametes versicolor]
MRTNDANRRTEGDVKMYVQDGESGLKGCEGEGGGGDVGEWSLVETMRCMIALEKERAELIEAIGKVDRSKKSERDAITTKVERFRVQARLAMVAYGKHVPPKVVQAHNAAKKRLPNQASRLVWRNEDDDRACGLGAHPMVLGVVPLDDEDLYGLNGSMENVGRYLPSKYHSVIRRHPAMAEAVAVERKLREGEANDALNTLRTLRDLRYAGPGTKHAHEVKEELGVNKKEDEAKVEYRRLRVLLRVLGMPEDDETYPAVRDEDPMQFVDPVSHGAGPSGDEDEDHNDESESEGEKEWTEEELDAYYHQHITVVVWYKAGTAPIRRQLAVLKRQSCPHFRVSELTSLPSIVALEKLEKWDRVMVQWMDFGRYEEVIDLDDDVHTYFVRVRGLVCAGFGRELDVSERAEERFGYPRQAVSQSIIGPKEGYMWVALWNENDCGAETYRFKTPHAPFIMEETEAFIAGVTGLEGAPFLCYWSAAECRWNASPRFAPMEIDTSAPLVLLRRPDVFNLHGVGDTLMVLEGEKGCKGPVLE